MGLMQSFIKYTKKWQQIDRLIVVHLLCKKFSQIYGVARQF